MRGTEHLHPELQGIVNRLIAECNRQGLPILITETLRSKAEQDGFYAQGRTKPGNVVTNVRYPHSMHCWGVAFDFCKNVKGQEYSDAAFFARVGRIGKSLGLTWGGDWTSFPDKPHFQLDRFGNTNQLISKYGTPERFLSAVNTEEERMEKIKIVINGKVKTVDVIAKDGQNYVKLRDLESDGIKIGFENKMPTVVTK